MITEGNQSHEPSLCDIKITIWTFPRIIVMVLIRLYQKIVSPALPANTCRFYPTCSHYAYEAICKYGILKGGYLSIYRLIRCNPFNEGGYDPVP
ncbi:MAG TPA: membrane protein insertion efficiency factor YidD [Anaerolineaceae bacterium]|nr:membrane protein insertion efficiency factor YidD [Anaerolineaceae bacterium]